MCTGSFNLNFKIELCYKNEIIKNMQVYMYDIIVQAVNITRHGYIQFSVITYLLKERRKKLNETHAS